MNYKYKYVHLLWANELKFIMPLVKMFNKPENGFDLREHLFVTTQPQVYEILKSYQGVILDIGSASVIVNKYAECSKWVFSHGIPSKREMLKIKRSNLKRLICRTWGGSRNKSTWDSYHPLKSVKNYILDGLYYLFYRFTLGSCRAVGIGNIVDELDLKEWHWADKTTLLKIDYPRDNLDEILATKMSHNSNNIRILVGHQGCPGEKHVIIIKQLLRFEQNFEIFVPLSYGNKDYINSVVEDLSNLNDSRIKVMTDLMPIRDYLLFLSSIDVAILDEPSSMALGNIAYLLHFRKKIFLNKNGIIRKAFDIEGVPYDTTDRIPNISFSELLKPVVYNEPLNSDLEINEYQKGVEQWKKAYAFLG